MNKYDIGDISFKAQGMQVVNYKGIMKCDLFARDCVGSNMDAYRQRGQSDKSLIMKQIRTGKIAEVGAYLHMLSLFENQSNIDITPPDFEIYKKEDKNFDADIQIASTKGVTNLHIKSCNLNSGFDKSWVFQKNDPLLTEPKSNDFVCPVIVEFDHLKQIAKCYIINVIPAGRILTLTKKLTKPSLNRTKTALYLEDIG